MRELTTGDGLAIVPVMIAESTFGLIAYRSQRVSPTAAMHFVKRGGTKLAGDAAYSRGRVGFMWFNATKAMLSWATVEALGGERG